VTIPRICSATLILLFSSCSRHPNTGDQYVHKTSREIITVAGVGKGHELLFADSSRTFLFFYLQLDSEKQCVQWIDSSSSSPRYVHIVPIKDLDSAYTLLSPSVKLHPRKGDWYENLGSRDRVKVDYVGLGKEQIEFLYKFKKDAARLIPMIVTIHGDSAQTANGQSVVIQENERYSGLLIMKYTIFSESDFERDHVLVH
jgi:hypothetical protein